MQDQNYERKISLLDWGIILSALLLLLVVYLPQSIWEEEEKLKKEGRKRMSDIANAEDFYFEMTGNYTLDGEHLFELVEAAMDSLFADSLFTGKKASSWEKTHIQLLWKKVLKFAWTPHSVIPQNYILVMKIRCIVWDYAILNQVEQTHYL